MITGTQAPTEKHLERWICANPHLFGETDPSVQAFVPFCEGIIAQQVTLSSGVADALALDARGMRVIEIKKGAIDWAVVRQLLRYLGDAKALWHEAAVRAFNERLVGSRVLDLAELEYNVGGLLVGYTIDDKSLIDACDAIGIKCVLYRFDAVRDRYLFQQASGRSPHQQRALLYDRNARVIGSIQQWLISCYGEDHRP